MSVAAEFTSVPSCQEIRKNTLRVLPFSRNHVRHKIPTPNGVGLYKIDTKRPTPSTWESFVGHGFCNTKTSYRSANLRKALRYDLHLYYSPLFTSLVASFLFQYNYLPSFYKNTHHYLQSDHYYLSRPKSDDIHRKV